ncbi:LysR family transcriptional regulator [Yinghuangia sp. YIM S10712]|uniref:LysR family transcriptional regulator n=1 Tax=Yinghuangia sp. YIM S10712 TaxID=3436930 RepID=UPI003F53B2E9
MDFKQLTALITVADAGSVTRAAELLGLAQPAVTQRIIGLEKELGVTLFERTWQGMRPTEAGLVMVHHARRVLEELKRARNLLRPTGVLTGTVAVGLLDSTADVLGERLLTAVTFEYPDIDLRVVTGHSGQLQQWMDDGHLDVSLLDSVHHIVLMHPTTLIIEKLWVAAPLSDRLRPDQPIPVMRLAERPLGLPAAGHALRTLIDTAAAQAGTHLDVVAESNYLPILRQFVLAGHGWAVLPGVAVAADLAVGLVSAAPVSEPEIHRSIVLGTPRARHASASTVAVARQVTREVKSAVADGRWYPAT